MQVIDYQLLMKIYCLKPSPIIAKIFSPLDLLSQAFFV
jgi:hypothetical protein